MKTLAVACACFAMTAVCVRPIQAEDAAKDPQPIAVFSGHSAEITTLAFSAEGSRVATVSSDRACFWDPSTGKEINRLSAAPYSVFAVSPDFRRLAIGGSFHFGTPGALNGKLALLECDSGKTVWSINPHGDWDQRFPFRPSITALAFSPDGKRLIASGSMTRVGGRHGMPAGVVKVWNAETGELAWERDRLSTRADAVVFSPDGRYVAGATGGAGGELPEPGEVFVMNAANGDRVHSFSQYSTLALALDPANTRLATSLTDGTVRLRELPSGRSMTLVAHRGEPGKPEIDQTGLILGPRKSVRCVAFNPAGTRLAAAGDDRAVRVWDVETGQESETFRFDVARINALAFSPDGSRLAAAGGETMQSGKCVVWKYGGK